MPPIFFREEFLLKSIITVDRLCFLEVYVLAGLRTSMCIHGMDSLQAVTFQTCKKLMKLHNFWLYPNLLVFVALLNHIFSRLFDYNK